VTLSVHDDEFKGFFAISILQILKLYIIGTLSFVNFPIQLKAY